MKRQEELEKWLEVYKRRLKANVRNIKALKAEIDQLKDTGDCI